MPLDQQSGTVKLDNRRIDYAGDIDVYRFFLATPRTVSVFTEGDQDTVGTILDSQGTAIEANDDANFGQSDHNFGITRKLNAGTYYVSVGHWDPQGTGTYHLRLRVENVDANNYTDLWWNPSESGWGINLNHQGSIIFATLFTYDSAHNPTWLVMSNGARQPDGSYQGDLYQVQGPAFDAPAWTGTTLATVGSMRLVFSANDQATLTYTFNGSQVTKSITRQVFATPPTCSWSAFDRSFTFNFQDLWWNPPEPGWGLNIAHQGKTMFATLFVYGADGKPTWFVMSNGVRGANFLSFSGPLYRTSGPVFNASPWTGATVTEVGSMSFKFNDGRSGTMTYTVNGVTVTKPIERQVFSSPATDCSS